MKANFSPSVNIERDQAREIAYILTPNAKRVAESINDLFNKGFHSFSIIGSYGSGKSAFLWAFEKSLEGQKDFFEIEISRKTVQVFRLVGEYRSLLDYLGEYLGIPQEDRNTKNVLKSLSGYQKEEHLLVLIVDEFGKLLEHAVKHNTEEEIYFLQQLAEYANDPKNQLLLITTLHQNFEAYAFHHLKEAERNEWKKVSGRFKNITFNEPIEQLLFLAAKRLENKEIDAEGRSLAGDIVDLQQEYHIVKGDPDFLGKIAAQIWPIDIIAAYILAESLQRYGQNERSLFTFLETEIGSFEALSQKHSSYGLVEVYNYLLHEFYSHLTTKYNLDYSTWSMVFDGLARVDTEFEENRNIAEDILKSIGLITLFGHKGAHLEEAFLVKYLSAKYAPGAIKTAIEELDKRKLIRFNRFNRSYKLFEGTDLNIEEELLRIGATDVDYIDVVAKLNEHFDFPVVNAKAVSYKFGTPRFFQYTISEEPLVVDPSGQIDGFINLVFSVANKSEAIIKSSEVCNTSVYVHFLNTEEIKNLLIDINKTEKVKSEHHGDKVAKKEFENILRSQRQILKHKVLDGLFDGSVRWYYQGKPIKIESTKALNKFLSGICETAYKKAPRFRNELINRHSISGSIHAAKKNYFDALAANWWQQDLGFEKGKFPPEKTIYLTLLHQTEIHIKEGDSYTFQYPSEPSFKYLWDECQAFIESAKNDKKKITELMEILRKKPYKLSEGFIEFWVPTFLFIKRDEFALFSGNGYQPELGSSLLSLFSRSPQEYSIKSFDVQGVKLDLYNKYRQFLQLKDTQKVSNDSLIESIKPFLVFYRSLNNYSKNTKRLGKETLALREAIEKAEEPEKLFFEQFPKALRVDVKELIKSDVNFEAYINQLREAIKEIRGCFTELVNRIELFLTDEVLHADALTFSTYKERIEARYAHLKEHMLLPKQVSFLMRLRTPIDDRNSWLNSLCQVAMGKSLDDLKDDEEEILKERLRGAFQELDNLSVITQNKKPAAEEDEEVIKLDITTLENGTVEEVIRISKKASKEAEAAVRDIEKSLSKDKKLNMYILYQLLKNQLDE